jgi:hypothetical protein
MSTWLATKKSVAEADFSQRGRSKVCIGLRSSRQFVENVAEGNLCKTKPAHSGVLVADRRKDSNRIGYDLFPSVLLHVCVNKIRGKQNSKI